MSIHETAYAFQSALGEVVQDQLAAEGVMPSGTNLSQDPSISSVNFVYFAGRDSVVKLNLWGQSLIEPVIETAHLPARLAVASALQEEEQRGSPGRQLIMKEYRGLCLLADMGVSVPSTDMLGNLLVCEQVGDQNLLQTAQTWQEQDRSAIHNIAKALAAILHTITTQSASSKGQDSDSVYASLVPSLPALALRHGDFKPSNVVIDARRVPYLIDPKACYGHAIKDIGKMTVRALLGMPPPHGYEFCRSFLENCAELYGVPYNSVENAAIHYGVQETSSLLALPWRQEVTLLGNEIPHLYLFKDLIHNMAIVDPTSKSSAFNLYGFAQQVQHIIEPPLDI